MKNLLLVLVTALVTSIATAIAVEFLRDERAPARGQPLVAPAAPAAASAPSAATVTAGEAIAPLPPLDDPELAERLAELEARLAKVEAARSPARVPVEGASPTAAPESWPGGNDARTFVLDVLEDERARRQREETEMWEARSAERLSRTASWLGEELGLGPQEQETLLGILREESFRRNEIFRSLRESESEPAREGARAEFEELRRWKETELTAQFGPAIAKSMLDLERDRFGPMRSFFPGGGFPGDDPRAPGRDRETPWPR